MIETSSDFSPKSSVIFGNLRKFWETFVWPSELFWRIFEKCSEIFGNSSETSSVCLYNK